MSDLFLPLVMPLKVEFSAANALPTLQGCPDPGHISTSTSGDHIYQEG